MPASVQFQTSQNLAKALRKVQADAEMGFNFTSAEVDVLKKVPSDGVDYSLRETLFPVDLNETGGVANLVESGKLARPNANGLEEGVGYLVHKNKRFNRSTLSRMAAKGMSNQVVDQFKFLAMKAVKAMNRNIAIEFWGSSSGILALTDTDITSAASQTIALRAAHGVTGQDNAGYLADLFVAGDGASNEGDAVAIILLTGPTIVAQGIVTAKNRTNGTLTIAMEGAPTPTTTNGLAVVPMNAIGTGLDQTSYNKALVGWTDAATSAALHSLTHPEWAPAVYDTAAVRFSPLLYQRGRDEAHLRGDATISHLFWDPAVKRDAWDNRASLQRFNDTAQFTLDGDIKAKNVEDIPTRFVPPGWVAGFDVNKAVKKIDVYGSQIDAQNGTGGLSEDGGKDYIDEAAKVYGLNRVIALQWRNRRATIAYTGKTRS